MSQYQKMTDREITEYIQQEAIDLVHHLYCLTVDLPKPSKGEIGSVRYLFAQIGMLIARIGLVLLARAIPTPSGQTTDSTGEGE